MFATINSNNKIKFNNYIIYYNKYFYTYASIFINIDLRILISLHI